MFSLGIKLASGFIVGEGEWRPGANLKENLAHFDRREPSHLLMKRRLKSLTTNNWGLSVNTIAYAYIAIRQLQPL